MGAHIRQWFGNRWPVSSLIHGFLDEKIRGGSRFAYIFGSASMFLFLLQVVTGVWQMFYYVPTVDHAYDSVSYLRFQVPFGWLIHGLHYWGANAFIVVLGCHAIRVFIWGAYKRPRELTWLLGVVLLILAASMIFTGAILPWDNMGYWAGEVGTSIAGTVPLIGNFLKLLLRGGATMEQLALARQFILHVALLPGVMALVILGHLVALRRFGSAGPWELPDPNRIGWFWPAQVFKDTIFISFLFVVLVALTAYVPAPIAGPADPLDSSYTPKPEWNFLFLYQGLKAFKGAWEPIGTIGIPVLILSLLVVLPFLDRGTSRSPAKRPLVMACGLLFVGAVVTLTVVGFCSAPGLPQETTAPAGPPATAASPEQIGPIGAAPASTKRASTQASVGTMPASQASVLEGRELFVSNGCGACHAIAGKAELLGPSLQYEAQAGRSLPWLRAQILSPRSNNPNTIMPAYPSLTPAQVDVLIVYMMSLATEAKIEGTSQPSTAQALPSTLPATPSNLAIAALPLPSPGQQGPPGPAARMIGNPDLGSYLYGQFCSYCHGAGGKGGIRNPGSREGTVPPLCDIDRDLFSRDPLEFAEKVDQYIQHGSRTPGPNPAMDMPAFGSTNTLTQQQIANLEAYALQANGVDRSQIIDPGMSPRAFTLLTTLVFATISLALAVAWRFGKRQAGSASSAESRA
jgi:ubiquinol-cytochrome c reductase cytochrome b subunit